MMERAEAETQGREDHGEGKRGTGEKEGMIRRQNEEKKAGASVLEEAGQCGRLQTQGTLQRESVLLSSRSKKVQADFAFLCTSRYKTQKTARTSTET